MSWRLILKLCTIKKKKEPKVQARLERNCIQFVFYNIHNQCSTLWMLWRCNTDLELISDHFSYKMHTPRRAHPARGHRLNMGAATLRTANPKHKRVCVCTAELLDTPVCSKELSPSRPRCFGCPVLTSWWAALSHTGTKGRTHCSSCLLPLPAQPGDRTHLKLPAELPQVPFAHWSVKRTRMPLWI